MGLKDLVVREPGLIVRQRMEVAEFFGFESRNKYEIFSAAGEVIGYVAEQQKGILGFLMRQFIGHWRSFSLHFFDAQRGLSFVANHPFRLLFQRLEIYEADGRKLGALQQRFAILKKKFDIENPNGQVIMSMEAGIFHFWTFPIFKNGREVGAIKKRWSGALSELFTDRDNFAVEFKDASLSAEDKILLLASALFVDINYFERKAD